MPAHRSPVTALAAAALAALLLAGCTADGTGADDASAATADAMAPVTQESDEAPAEPEAEPEAEPYLARILRGEHLLCTLKSRVFGRKQVFLTS